MSFQDAGTSPQVDKLRDTGPWRGGDVVPSRAIRSEALNPGWLCRKWAWPQQVLYIFFTNGLELEDVDPRSLALNCKIFHVKSASVFPLRKKKKQFCPWNVERLFRTKLWQWTKYTVFYINMKSWSLVQKATALFSCEYTLMEGFQGYKAIKGPWKN